jgi:hypothetical protein
MGSGFRQLPGDLETDTAGGSGDNASEIVDRR